MTATSLQYRLTSSKSGYRQLDQALLDMGNLRNALIRHGSWPPAPIKGTSPSSYRLLLSRNYAEPTRLITNIPANCWNQ